MHVRNVGDGAVTFNDTPQKAYDAASNEYSADTEAGLYANVRVPPK